MQFYCHDLDQQDLIHLTVYKCFVWPLFRYAMLSWTGATQVHLEQLNQIQRRAIDWIGVGALLDSLAVRWVVAGLTYLYKLHTGCLLS